MLPFSVIAKVQLRIPAATGLINSKAKCGCTCVPANIYKELHKTLLEYCSICIIQAIEIC